LIPSRQQEAAADRCGFTIPPSKQKVGLAD
jgi:hypothetical protein